MYMYTILLVSLGRTERTCSVMVRDKVSRFDFLFLARRVVCVWKFNPCLTELKRNSRLKTLGSDTTCFDKEDRHYLHSVIQERDIVDCNATKVNASTIKRCIINVAE